MAMSALLVALAGCASSGGIDVEEASLTGAVIPSASSASPTGFETLDLDTVSGSGGSLGA